MRKFKNFALKASQWIYCIFCAYVFLYCCYASMKPVRSLFGLLPWLEDMLFDMYEIVHSFFIYLLLALAILTPIAMFILLFAYNSKAQKAIVALSMPVCSFALGRFDSVVPSDNLLLQIVFLGVRRVFPACFGLLRHVLQKVECQTARKPKRNCRQRLKGGFYEKI